MGYSGMFSDTYIFAKLTVDLCELYNPRDNTVWKMGTVTMQNQNSNVPKV